MKKVDNKTGILLALGIGSLILGALIYIVVRQDTYLSKVVLSYFGFVNSFSPPPFLNNALLRYYLPDFLWALSLSCALQLLLKPRGCGQVLCSAITFLFGAGYECLQLWQVIGGTGDIIDIGMYALAAFSVNLLSIKRRKKNEKDS